MLRNAENHLYRAIGKFSTIGLPTPFISNAGIDTPQATQCTAFLCSNREFTWFIESWDVNRNGSDLALENKKVYPAKVTGLNLASPLLVQNLNTETVSWREGLIGSPGYRPGFGESVLYDISRPLLQQSIQQNDLLGTGSNSAYTSFYKNSFSRQLGRLMSMAFYVDPIAAAKYDASKSAKKKKSLNSQDYEQTPTYPTYTAYPTPTPTPTPGGGY